MTYKATHDRNKKLKKGEVCDTKQEHTVCVRMC